MKSRSNKKISEYKINIQFFDVKITIVFFPGAVYSCPVRRARIALFPVIEIAQCVLELPTNCLQSTGWNTEERIIPE